MPSTTILLFIGQYALALLGGIVFYYVIVPHKDKLERKQAIDLALSFIVNFIIYIWLAKIIILLPLFLKDPLSVLPYPSDSRMFYVATVFIVIHMIIAMKRNKINGKHLMEVLVPILLMSNFIYEFFEIVWNNFGQSWSTFILYSVLLFIYLFFKQVGNIWIIRLWAIMQCIVSLYFSYTVIFGYMISSYYFILILLMSGIVTLLGRSREINGNY